MEIIKTTNYSQKEILVKANLVLAQGGLVVYPTETCYGLGADATNQQAIDKLLTYKRRREGKPLSILVKDQQQAEEYVLLNDSAKNLYQNFLPGPITVISQGKGKVAIGVESEMQTLGIRISSHPLAQALIANYDKPITATSANASFKKKPYSIDDLLNNLTQKQKEKLDLIIDAGELPKRKSSTVVDTTLVGSMVLRRGDLDLGKNQQIIISTSEEDTKKLAQNLMLKNFNKLKKQALVFALVGDLGTGKTIFAKGIGQFLKIPDAIVSPSFTLVNEYHYQRYETEGFFYHLDPWRLTNFAQFQQLAIEEMLVKQNVIVIEWANKFLQDLENFLKTKSVQLIKLAFKDLGDNQREIRIK
ncbi:threonylcarbamoyl-AMP synthase [Candidatus Beckwithbacteria bacterium]|nr:threonylcarbamoyl-AMP synthase [Candidatus Beckwithbacteria bacterium]